MGKTESTELKLDDGSTVLIIGGGPAGCSCALKLRALSEERGISLKIIIFEDRDFKTYLNHCAGVLSPPFVDILSRELLIDLPASLVSRKIFGYRLHVDEKEILLVGEDRKGPTYSIQRIDFDRFLLERARSLGIEIIPQRVTCIEFIRDRDLDRVRVFSQDSIYWGDVVVGAFGSDEESMAIFEKATSRAGPYRRPSKFLKTISTGIPTEQGFIEKKLGNLIYAFLAPKEISSIEFGAITPKKDHIFVNISGEKVTPEDLDFFFRTPPVRRYISLAPDKNIDYFKFQYPTAPAQNPYGRRYVTVGDATGWIRPLKGKGINTAVLTGIRAARTMMSRGVSKDAFREYETYCRELLEDYHYGMFVRFICNKFSRSVLQPLIELAKTDPFLYDSLYQSVSGHDTFKHILRSMISLRNMRKRTSMFLAERRKEVQNITIRALTVRDIDAMMRIDEEITGKPHESFWESKVAAYLEREPGACIAAVDKDRLVGFILGDIRGWEFAVPLTGWIEVIGVDKNYQGKGVGKALINALLEYFRQNNIEYVQAMINWNDGDILDYFRSMGFERGEYINLIKKID